METGKQGFVNVPALGGSVVVHREDRMRDSRTPLPTMYLQTLGGLPLYPQAQPPTSQDALAALPLSISPLPAKQTLPLLTFHITSETPLQQQNQRLGALAPVARPKSTGKHVCPHCGRDCLKPSVLEKHLRCHTGERPYPCTTCGVAFKTQSNLYKHKRTQAHARLSSESEKRSLSSQESVPGSGDTRSSSPSVVGQSEDSESFESDIGAPPVTHTASSSAQPPATLGKIGSNTGWALHQAALVGLILAPVNGNQEKLSSMVQKTELSMGLGTTLAEKPPKIEQEEQRPASALLTLNRHLLLQRQEATFFSKQWEPCKSRGKSQSHDSTDSGFSESNEQHCTASPGSTQHDHSMESLTESSMEHQVEFGPLDTATDPAAAATSGAKSRVSMLEKRKLEERISKLISENDALVDDKRLENVRPRKTVLSKQGSIDLPMPYTYKDSFHFEMRTNKQASTVSSWQSPDRRVKQALYNSVPTQRSTSLDHSPLTRSSSLPFSLGSPGLERSSQYGHYQKEDVPLSRKDSSGQLYPGEFVMKSVDQQVSHHRSLVRQSAVDCLPAAEGLTVTSSVEETYPSSLGSDGDSIDLISESSGGKCRRKKAQKFSYSKWHMYGGGTFTKLYNVEKGSDHGSFKAKKAVEKGKVHEIQTKNIARFTEPSTSVVSTIDQISAASNVQTTRHPPCLPDSQPSSCGSQPAQGHSSHVSSESCLQRPVLTDLSGSAHHSGVRQNSLSAPDCTNDCRAGLVKEVNQEEHNTQHNTQPQCLSHLPSERKKQRTEDGTSMLVASSDSGEKGHNTLACVVSKAGDNSLIKANQPPSSLSSGTTPKHTYPTDRGDSNKLHLQHQGNRMEFNLCFINHHLNQRSVQAKEHGSLPSLVNVARPSASPSVSAAPSMSASTKSSFLPKYQLKLPHPAGSGPALEDSLTAIPASEQSLTAVPASEQSLIAIPALEQTITAIPALEQSLTAIPALEQTVSAIPALEQTVTAIPTATSEHSHTTPTIDSNRSNTPTPKTAIKQKHSTPNLALALTRTATFTSSKTHTATPTSGHSHTASPTQISEQNYNATPTPVPQLSHTAMPTLEQMQTASLMLNTKQGHSATPTSTSQQSDTAPPSSVCVNLNTYLPMVESQSKGKVILLKSVPHATSEETDDVKTGDIQIVLQIISDEQLSLMEAQLHTQDSQLEARVCHNISQAAVENVKAEKRQQSVLQKLNISHDAQFLAHNAQGSNVTEIAHSNPAHKASSSTQSSGSSILSDWETFSHKEQHEYQGCEKYSQKNSIPGVTHRFPNPSAQIDVSEDHQNPVRPSRKADSSELRSNQSQHSYVHQEPQMHKQYSPAEHGDPPLTNNSEFQNEERSEVCLDLLKACPQEPQQLIRADEADCLVLIYSKAPPPSLTSSTVTIDRSAYPQLYIPGKQPELRCHSAPEETHIKTLMTGNKERCFLEKPTLAELVGSGDISSTLHPSYTSNPLLICPNAEPPHIAAISQHSAQTSTCESPNIFQGFKSQSPVEKQGTVDTVKEISIQTVPGCASLLTDLGQWGTDTAASPLTPCHRLQNQIQKCALSVTQVLPQQATSENIAPVFTSPGSQAQKQGQMEKHTQQASVYHGSVVPFSQTSIPTPTASSVSQHELVSASLPGQHKLCLAAGISLSPTAAAQISSGSVLLHVSVEHKPLNQREQCNVGEQGNKCEIYVNEAVVNPSETPEGFCVVWPGCSIQGSGVAKAGLSGVKQHTEASPSFLSNICFSTERGAPHLQELVACTGTSAGTLQTKTVEHSLRSSNALCKPSTRPFGRSLTGGSLSISSLVRSQMQVSSNEPQDQVASLQGLEQTALQEISATGQKAMAFDSFASVPGCVLKEKTEERVLICAPADIQKESQDSDTGHQQSLSPSGSAAQRGQDVQGSGRRHVELEHREAEEQRCRGREAAERGGMENRDSRRTDKQEMGDPCASPSSVPTKGATSEDDVKEKLDDDGCYSHKSSSVLVHTTLSTSQSETYALRTVHVQAQRETSALLAVQTPSQIETSALYTLQSLTQSETSTFHNLQTPTQSETSALYTLQSLAECETNTFHTIQTSTQSETSDLHTLQRCITTTQPLQRSFLSVARGVQSGVQSMTAHTSARNTSWRPTETVTCGVPVLSGQPSTLQAVPAAVYSYPFLSHASATHCSLSLSVRSSDMAVRAGQSSLEEADTSSSDDEGRLVIELE